MKIKNIVMAGSIALIIIAGGIAAYMQIQANSKPVKVLGETNSFVSQWGKSTIVIGLDQEYPPMTFRDEKGNLVGFDVDLAKEAFKRMGLQAVFKPMDWSTIVLSLTKKDIDVIWSGMTITDERKLKINFTDAYFKGPYVYITKPGSEVKSKADLAGKIIGVQAGSSNEEAFKNDPIYKDIKELKSYASFQESLLDLDSGRIDAVYADSVFAYYYINSKGMNYKIIEEANSGLGAGVGIRKEDTALLYELNKVLNQMKEDGSALAISIKWFGKDMIVK